MACCVYECAIKYPEGNDDDDEPLLDYEKARDGRTFKCLISLASLWLGIRRFFVWLCCLCSKCCKCIIIPLLILLLLTLIILFVVLPVIFMNSRYIQKSLIFKPTTGAHWDYEVNFLLEQFNLDINYEEKPRNFYIEVHKWQNISLGAWYVPFKNYQYHYNPVKNSWENMTKPALLYFHQEIGDRKAHVEMYNSMREIFNIIPFDYRSYGDSTDAELIEEGLVEDSVAVYKWLRNKTNVDIYIWGDSLGSSIAAHAAARLGNESMVPTGLILEDPFTTLSDVIANWYWPLGKIFSWLPWYKVTITDPLERNGFSFKTSEYVVDVDCPMMILQWKKSKFSDLTDKVISILESDAHLEKLTVLTMQWYYSKYYSGDVEDSLKRFVNDYSPN